MKRFIIIGLILFTITSCWLTDRYKYDTGHFPEKPTNLSDINSEYDDYNSAEPNIYYRYLFHFSSNRKSSGKDFDIVGEKMFIDWSKDNGTLEIGTNLTDDNFDYLFPMFDSVNSDCNELGPYSVGYCRNINSSGLLWTHLMLYATDCTGNFDIKFISCDLDKNTYPFSPEIKHPQEIRFLNSDANDLYPSFYSKDFYFNDYLGFENDKIEKILYCSDREGKFNIYEVNINTDSPIIATLKSDQNFESIKLGINSDSDDKCPFVNGKLLVFSSNRPGGYGGFDLYYSIIKNGSWSEPVNFGEKINSESDDYRPITLFHDNFSNNLMIFSSNRPGGKGGFDLYYCGIKQMIK